MKNLAKYPKILCRRTTALLIAFVMIAAGVFGTGVTVNAEGTGTLESTEFLYAYDVQRKPEYPTKGDTITASFLSKPMLADGTRGTTNNGSWKLKKCGTYSSIKGTSENFTNLQVIVSEIASNYTGLTEDNIVIHELTNGGVHIAYGVTLAYDSTNGLAVFFGDPLYGGAGYLLSTGSQQSDSVTISANLDVTDWTPTAHTHAKGTHHEKIEATCVLDGKVEYWDCANGCDKKLDTDGNVINTTTDEQLVIHRTGHTLKKTDAISSTVESTGIKAYWTCESCGLSYADENGKTEIGNTSALETWKANASASGGQIERVKAEIIEGANGKWTQDSKTPLAFRSNASFDKFLRVEVDGAVVDAEKYDAKSGSIIVSLHADYLNTLSVGEHTLAIVSKLDSGETKASTTFTVAKKDAGTTVKKDTTNKNNTTKTKTVKTGDNSQMTVWLVMMVIAFAVMVTVFVVNKKQRFYNRHTHKR